MPSAPCTARLRRRASARPSRSWARRAAVRFAISTDAHAVPHLDYLRFGVATAQRGWAETAEVISTYPLAKLRRFLAHGKPASSRRP
jgi:DNA polymerase (family X)